MKAVRAGSVEIGGEALVVIAGPCLAESRGLCEDVAGAAKEICGALDFPYVFKASFDKANRTSIGSARGGGIESGLEMLNHIRTRFGVPTTTDIHLPDQAAQAAQAVDLLQIPAFLCRQSDILHAAAATGLPVNVKKGQFLAPQDTQNIVRKLEEFGAKGVMLTERGTTFGYNALVVDMAGLEIMRGQGVPVCFDATHSAQRPGSQGESTGGSRAQIPALARAAVAVGIDALFLEVHPDPASALSDSATQWPLARLGELLESIHEIRTALGPPSP